MVLYMMGRARPQESREMERKTNTAPRLLICSSLRGHNLTAIGSITGHLRGLGPDDDPVSVHGDGHVGEGGHVHSHTREGLHKPGQSQK